MALELVVFDWYGTLASPHSDDLWTRMPEIIEAAGGRIMRQALEEWETLPLAHEAYSTVEAVYRKWQDRRLDALLEACGVPQPRRSQLASDLAGIRYRREFHLFPEARSALQALRSQGLRLGICSNWDWDLDRQLRVNDIRHLFDTVVCSASIGFRKPHPMIFEAVARRAGVSPDRAVFVGDSWEVDVIGARNAGFHVVHVARTPCAVADHGSISCVSDLTALPQRLPGAAARRP